MCGMEQEALIICSFTAPLQEVYGLACLFVWEHFQSVVQLFLDMLSVTNSSDTEGCKRLIMIATALSTIWYFRNQVLFTGHKHNTSLTDESIEVILCKCKEFNSLEPTLPLSNRAISEELQCGNTVNNLCVCLWYQGNGSDLQPEVRIFTDTSNYLKEHFLLLLPCPKQPF